MEERTLDGRVLSRYRLAWVALWLALSAQVLANPMGASVVSGQAGFSASGNTLTVTNTPGAIIHWQDFSIGANEATRFIQQSASSAVLNRVVTNSPSAILGSLQSNGRVFLVNPNGIVFGAGSSVDVAGMVASTLNMSNADFLTGRYRFTQVPGAQNISNAGHLSAQSGGQIYLIAPNVENTGVITAPNGEILLAAGNSVELVNSMEPNLRVSISAAAGDATNVGQLLADAGSLGLFGAIVKNSGTASADSAAMQGGRIVFRAARRTEITGAVSADGTTGGTIRVLGNEVGVMDGAIVSADGMQGGGTVLVGGDYRGNNADVPNAQVTYVSPNTSISANATQNGNGGKVIVWADDTARVYGNISARGGTQGGDGGFVETSGKRLLDVTHAPDVSAPFGKAGTWLLDPYNITVVAAGGTLDALTPNFTASANNSTITNTIIQNALNAGAYVILDTGTAGAQAGDITVNAPINVTGQGVYSTLTLNAANNIFINSPITKDAAATTTSFYLYLYHNTQGTAPNSSVTLASTTMIRGVDYVNVANIGSESSGLLHVLGASGATSGLIGGGTAQNFNVDDSWFAYPLPFGFSFYGVTYNTMYVASNGIITFGSGTSQYWNNTADFRTLYQMIAPAWSDWVTWTGVVAAPNADIYIHQPSAGSIAVRWDVAHYGNNNATANFEAVLSQSGDIAFNYGAATNLPGHFSTIGVSSGDGVHYTLSALSDIYSLNNLPTTTFSYNSATGNYIEALSGLVAAPAPPPPTVIDTLMSGILASVTNINSPSPIVLAAADTGTDDENKRTAQGAVVGSEIAPASDTTPAASLPVCQ